DYLLFAGRLSPEKGPCRAIRVAKGSGRRLILAGMIEPQYQDYFDHEIKPHLDGRDIEYAGLLSQDELSPLYRKAAGLLFLINWCEPFGLVAVEAQASGTPIIATRYGALPEIIRHEETGFVVDSMEEAIARVGDLSAIQPKACRRNAVERFTTDVMGRGYLKAYEAAIEGAAVGRSVTSG
ncbi:MAG: glycosyltransferase, partial [Phycisphaerae bacterium]